MPYYKTLKHDGQSAFGRQSEFVGRLPTDDSPGPWVEVDGEVRIDFDSGNGDNGIHLCRDVETILDWPSDCVFECEFEGEHYEDEKYLIAKRVRLTRRLDTWNDAAIRGFSAECAERVLHYYEAKFDDHAPRRAIETAKRLASSTSDDRDDLLDEAYAAAMRVAEEVQNKDEKAYLAAVAAAYSSQGYCTDAEAFRNASAHARRIDTDERRWQVARLKEILGIEGQGCLLLLPAVLIGKLYRWFNS